MQCVGYIREGGAGAAPAAALERRNIILTTKTTKSWIRSTVRAALAAAEKTDRNTLLCGTINTPRKQVFYAELFFRLIAAVLCRTSRCGRRISAKEEGEKNTTFVVG